jgi:hypothetical protein
MASIEKSAGTSKGKGRGKEKGDGPVKKVGNPGNFRGERLAFLEGQLPIYLAKKGRVEVTDFFTKILGLWWAKFPWYEGYGPDGKPLRSVAGSASTTSTPTNITDATTPSAPGLSADVASNATLVGPVNADASEGTGDIPTGGALGSAGPWAATGGVNPELRDKIKGEIIAVRILWCGFYKVYATDYGLCLAS